jgi:hypothetical protein
MFIDISNFLIVFGLFLTAWAMFFSWTRSDDPHYSSFLISLFTFFRAALGDFDLDTLIQESADDTNVWLQTIAFVVFLLVAAVLLLNLLISIMSTTYERVQAKGDAESAKAFLDTISEGENHAIFDFGALPPPFNVIYGFLLFPYLVGTRLYVRIKERDPKKRQDRYEHLKNTFAAPTLMRVVLLPVTLPLVALTTLPAFMVMVLVSPLVPLWTSILDEDSTFYGNACAAKLHVMLPAIQMRRMYLRYVNARVEALGRYCRCVLLATVVVPACVVVASVVFILGMPVYWVYEAAFRSLGDGSDGLQNMLKHSARLAGSGGSVDGCPHMWLNEESLHDMAFSLLQRGKLVLDTENEDAKKDFLKLLGEEEDEPSNKNVKHPTLAPNDESGKGEMRTHVQAFMRDVKTLDVGLLWCCARHGRLPNVSASQLERTFANSHGHEGRTERALEKVGAMLEKALKN